MTLSFGDAIEMEPYFDIGGYQEPAGFNTDWFDPDNQSNIDWADIYGNTDVLQGIGENVGQSLTEKATDYIKQLTDKGEENKYLENTKSNIGFGTDKTQQMFQQVSPSVTLTRDGLATGMNPYGSSGAYGNNLAASNMRFAQADAPSWQQTLGQGVQKYATNMILGAIPGVGPALAVANAAGVDIPGAVQSGMRFAGDAISGAGNFISNAWEGITDWLCDERLKVDIASLESTEVNDELAQMAFFVKGIRECS